MKRCLCCNKKMKSPTLSEILINYDFEPKHVYCDVCYQAIINSSKK